MLKSEEKNIDLKGTDNYDKVSKYLLDMKRVLCEMHRVLVNPGIIRVGYS